MRVRWPERQTRATIENDPSGSTCNVCARYWRGSPSRCSAVRMSGPGRWRRSWWATALAIGPASLPVLIAPRTAAVSSANWGADVMVVVIMLFSLVDGPAVRGVVIDQVGRCVYQIG